MPTLHRLGNRLVKMYPRDHEPPHFHLEAPNFAVKIELGTWRVVRIAGRARDLGEVLEWARENEALLWRRWHETRSG